MTENIKKNLEKQIKSLPRNPGVYLFKDSHDLVLYIGKAKSLRSRVSSYLKSDDLKSCSLREISDRIDFIVTKNELEAMLLEAKLIQTHQPKFNVLLKTGQPFLWILISQESLPELKLVRSQKQKGTYFGPFLEKDSARKVYDFLIKTFRLKLCKKKIPSGCLAYHMGICAGKCRPDFDENSYQERIELAKLALKGNHADFLKHLKNLIKEHNKKMEFEKSRQLHNYIQAFERVFDVLETKTITRLKLDEKDIWFLTEDKTLLFLFKEKNSVLIKKEIFYIPVDYEVADQLLTPLEQTLRQAQGERSEHLEEPARGELVEPFQRVLKTQKRSQKDSNIKESSHLDFFESYYRTYPAPSIILVNFDIDQATQKLYQQFIKSWHNKSYDISIVSKPESGHFADLIRLAKIHVDTEISKQTTLPKALKNLLQLPIEPHTIDCFDISHKQGMYMVGSCVRFTDGKPDKKNFRHFYIKSIEQQNDYAALHEIVQRRYKNIKELPDLILIDGGKGQLNAVKNLFPKAEFASLAKKEETIFSKRIPEGKKLNLKSFVGQILTAIRDYAHHFAISFHRKVEHKNSFDKI
ncbi:MAG: GIY-YIG nuclease family protein [Candidatus Babeliales bacterium]